MGILGDTPNDATVTLNFIRQRAPASGDDIDSGYGVGSHWTDTVNARVYICTSHAVGAANWVEVVGTTTPDPPDPPPGDQLINGTYSVYLNTRTVYDTAAFQRYGQMWLDARQGGIDPSGGWQNQLGRYKNFNPKGRVLHYQAACEGWDFGSAIGYSSRPPQATRMAANSGCCYNEAVWWDTYNPNDRVILRTSTGAPFLKANGWPSYTLHPSPALSNLMIANIQERYTLQPWDGVYYDNVLNYSSTSFTGPLYKYVGGAAGSPTSGTLTLVYPSPSQGGDQMYGTDTLAHVRRMNDVFRADGMLISANCNAKWDAAPNAAWYPRCVTEGGIDMVQREYAFQRNNAPSRTTNPTSGGPKGPIGSVDSAWYNDWAGWMNAINGINSVGGHPCALTALWDANEVTDLYQLPNPQTGYPGDNAGFARLAVLKYARASFLLLWTGSTMAGFAGHYSGDDTSQAQWDNWNYGGDYLQPELGYPVSPGWPNTYQSNGCYARRYDNGWVVVNPSDSTRVISPGTFGGWPTSSLTLTWRSAYLGG